MNAKLPPRGIRMNNPGNIRIGPKPYLGELVPSSDPEFREFKDPVYGLRAIGKTLDTYWLNDGISTIRGAIDRWAPPSENDTASYIADVASKCGCSADELVPLPTAMPHLIAAIVTHENGEQPYSDDQIAEAVGLVLNPPPAGG